MTRKAPRDLRDTVVPLVTPVGLAGDLDEASLDRLLEFELRGGVAGVFVLGTTGEGVSVPRGWRLRFVKRTVDRVRGRALVYAGIGDTCLADSITAGHQYLEAGVDVLVAQPPVYFPLRPADLLAYFKTLLDSVAGPLVIYNIPSTTRVSIPLDVLAQLLGHPNLVGIKDSENDAPRLEEVLKRFGGRENFSIFIGVGVLMAKMLKLGADGIVPSVGNLIPAACRDLCEAAKYGDWAAVEGHSARMNAVASLYQNGRTLGESLAALKTAMCHRGLLGSAAVLPPLRPLEQIESESLRSEMEQLQLLA